MNKVPAHKIEPLIFKLGLTDTKYTSLLNKYFEKDWFEDQLLARTLEVGLKYYQKYFKLPSLDTLDILASKIFKDDYNEVSLKLKSIYSTDLNTDIEFVDDQILEYLMNRGLYWTIMSSIESIEKHHNVEECIEKLRTLSTMSFDDGLGFDYFNDLDKHITELQNPEAKISCGWKSLDKITNGGFPKDGRCLIMFSGKSHIGKSLVLSNLACNAIRDGKFPVIITLEMSEFMYTSRIDAHLTGIDVNRLKENIAQIKSVADTIKTANPNSKLILKEFAPDSINCNHIKSYIDKIITSTKRKPDLLLVDYLGLLVPNENSKHDILYTKYGNIAKQLRALSYIYKIPVISANQVSKAGYDTTAPALEHTSDSMGVVHIADFMAALWQQEGDREAGIINLSILKNRIGGHIGKTIQFNIDYSNLLIKDIATKETPEELANSIMSEIEGI